MNLTEDAILVLNNSADILKAYPTLHIRIEGYTDVIGTETNNHTLGARRARVVRLYLMNAGVDGSRLQTASMGEDKPATANTTAKGRKLNRRAEFKVIESGTESAKGMIY